MLQKVIANKSSGPDNLSPIILKCFSNYFAPSIISFINRSLTEGVLPSEWLKANVCPVYKGKGGNYNVCNYRPVSLLCVTSKVAERCIYTCIIDPIRTFIYDFQHEFLKSRSTTTQLVQVFSDIQYGFDNNGQSDVLYLDLSKAFDTIPHDLLILKLKYYGFHGSLLKWLCSYLSGRQQRVFISGVPSTWLPLTPGVPQKSILGPLLFLLYINGLPVNVRHSKIALFADANYVKNVKRCSLMC